MLKDSAPATSSPTSSCPTRRARPSPYELWFDLGELIARTQADFDPTTPEARAGWEAEHALPATA